MPEKQYTLDVVQWTQNANGEELAVVRDATGTLWYVWGPDVDRIEHGLRSPVPAAAGQRHRPTTRLLNQRGQPPLCKKSNLEAKDSAYVSPCAPATTAAPRPRRKNIIHGFLAVLGAQTALRCGRSTPPACCPWCCSPPSASPTPAVAPPAKPFTAQSTY